MASAETSVKPPSKHASSYGCPVRTFRATSPLNDHFCPIRAENLTLSGLQDPVNLVPEEYRNRPLSEAQKIKIKASIPVFQKHGLDITKSFYQNMLGNHPGLKDIFNNANQNHFQQPRALARALLTYAQNIDDLSVLGEMVELIAAKHASLFVQPEQYPIVGQHLIEAIAQTLGDSFTPDLVDAWVAAYWQLAGILIKRENELYKAFRGGTDWADFKIVKKITECAEVVSFYLEPVDEALKPLPLFLPGQVRQTVFFKERHSYYVSSLFPSKLPCLRSVISKHDSIRSVSHRIRTFFVLASNKTQAQTVALHQEYRASSRTLCTDSKKKEI
jgi:hemoglobin-like flavoprotein